MKYIIFTDDNEENEYKFYIGETSLDTLAVTYTSRRYQDDEFNELVELIYEYFGEDYTFAAGFLNTDGDITPPDNPNDRIVFDTRMDHFKSLLSYAKYNYGVFSTNDLSYVCDDLHEFPYDTFLHLKGSDPETRRYIKFFNNVTRVQVYDSNKQAPMTEYGIFINNIREQLNDLDKIVFTDFDAFAAATSLSDALQYARRQNVHVVDMAASTPSLRYGVYSIQQTGVFGNQCGALWYILQSGADIHEDTGDDDPYSGDDAPYEPAEPGGGDGDGENPYDPGDPNPVPDFPPVSIGDSGLMSVYIPTSIQLNLLGAYLWSSNFIDSLVKDLYADPMDVIISLGFLPFYIVAGGTRNIKVGDRDSGVSASYPRDKYITVDCGSIDLRTTIGAYIDYAPYTHGELYIPFVGMVPLDVDAFMGHRIGIEYTVEICTGAAVAFVKCDGNVYQTFACNLMTPIPLSSANYSQMWQTVIGATAALAGAGIAGSAGMGAAAGAGEAAEGAQELSSQSGNAAKASSGIMSAAATKPSIQKSNNVSVLAGIMANRKPFILLYRPNLMLPKEQNKYQGYPSYIQTSLSSLTGYTRVSSINLAVPSATGEEIKMIDAILKSGFLIGDGEPLSGNGIVLGANISPTHQIRKHVNVVDTLTGTFRDSVDVLNPIVRIERTNPVGFNYVYISALGRRYFVEDVTIVRTGILDLHLRVDVLDTFANEILGNTAIIDKQEKAYNLYLNDDSIKMRQDPLVTCKVFPHGMFENNLYTYVLCVAGN